MLNKSLFSSNTDEWSTPDYLFYQLDLEFHFTLDPCASIDNHKCDNFYTLEDDGLSKDWGFNSCFVNPPYSNIKNWVYKCYLEHFTCPVIVMLIPSRTDTSYFHDYILPYCEIRFIRGRLHFSGSKNSAPFPSMICIFRSHNNFLNNS